ncbi:MAG: hypothetical protein M1836_002884 [Candelina mexicana]|nr:MAG: hypothetical protein M1836_002884 [Candelina mexicana]
MSPTANNTHTMSASMDDDLDLPALVSFGPNEDDHHSRFNAAYWDAIQRTSRNSPDLLQGDLSQGSSFLPTNDLAIYQMLDNGSHTNFSYQQPQAGLSPPQMMQMIEPDLSRSRESSASPESPAVPSKSFLRFGPKNSSYSSQSALAGTDAAMKGSKNVKGESPEIIKEDYEIMSEELDILNDDADMNRHFDFDTAASSPSALAGSSSSKISNQSLFHDSSLTADSFPDCRDIISLSGPHKKASMMHRDFDSCEGSPTYWSQSASPSTFYTTPSPPVGSGLGPMLNGALRAPQRPNHDVPSYDDPSSLQDSSFTMSPVQPTIATSLLSQSADPPHDVPSVLTIQITENKRRVETQLGITMILHPMPSKVTKLHLPTHTISKAKNQVRPPPKKSPDTLELGAVLVCSSAMANPVFKQRALNRAAGYPVAAEATEAGDEQVKPLNGGEVQICKGCVLRERKRADRKKNKDPEAEEAWQKDEWKRVIVFNTNELRKWDKPAKQSVPEQPKHLPPIDPEIANTIRFPMRIACYCRHQSEKTGYNVIFTLKDHKDNFVAQTMTSDIMITDDHKNVPYPSLLPNNESSTLGEIFQKNAQQNARQNANRTDSATFAFGPSYAQPQSNGHATNPFRHSYSTTDLESLQHSSVPQFNHPAQRTTTSQITSQNTSRSHTPRNLSRPASPSGSSGPVAKKRRSNGSGKVPNGLMMTQVNTVPPQPMSNMPSSAFASSMLTTMAQASGMSNPTQYVSPPNQSWLASPPSRPLSHSTEPPTPISSNRGFFDPGHRSQSMENLSMDQFFSAQSSAHPSRVPSPSSTTRNNPLVYQQAPAQFTQAVESRLQLSGINSHRPPLINKLVPSQGPTTGGIEVTCLGSGFFQGVELMFGDQPATTTTFWGESTLCALLPPATKAGPVPVTFKHEYEQQTQTQTQTQAYPTPPNSNQQTQFTYVDNASNDLMKLALMIVGNKMNGGLQDVGSIARNIIQGNSQLGPSNQPHGHGASQHRQANSFDVSILGSIDVETNLIKCLELIDLDDSPHQPRLSLRQSNGQTMLMLASSLGMSRFVAGLVARGVAVDAQDKSGFTALHFASLHGQTHIVRRLLLGGAIPTMESVRGYRPADMTTSIDVLDIFQSLERRAILHGARMKPLNRPRSAASLKSLWRSSSPGQWASGHSEISDLIGVDINGSDDDGPVQNRGSEYCAQSRTSSRRSSSHIRSADLEQPPQGTTVHPSLHSPAAAMVAWRGQLATQIQNFQQHVQLNLPNLQVPALPPMPNLPDYQTSPMVRRISSLVPHRIPSRPSTLARPPPPSKESEYRWWELFSASPPPPPPAYDEIFPENNDVDVDIKKSSAIRAAADAAFDLQYADEYDQVVAKTSTVVARHQTSARSKSLTREQQEELRAAHARKVKRIRSDRNLFFIWLPLLVIILTAMLKNWVPDVLDVASKAASFVQGRLGERVFEIV